MTRAAALLLALGFGLTFALDPWADERVTDLPLYASYAELFLTGSLPYRDVAFEYPPFAAPVLALGGMAGTDPETYRIAFAALMAACLLALVVLCGRLAALSGGDARRAQLAAAAVPLLCGALVRNHLDLVPVVMVVGALVLVLRDRPVAGLALLGVGTMTKLFPLAAAVVVLAWLAAGDRPHDALRGGIAFGGVATAVALAALALSPEGAWEAVAYHADRPVQVESLPALGLLVLDALGAGEAAAVNSFRSDGLLHPAAGALTALTAGLLLAALTAYTLAVRRGRGAAAADPRTLVLAALGAVAAFASLGKVLSPQFVVWVLPLGALALSWRMHRLAAAVAAAAVLTLAEFPSRYFDVVAREPGAIALVAVRDAALVAVLALAGCALRSRPVQAPGSARSPWRARRGRPRPAPR